MQRQIKLHEIIVRALGGTCVDGRPLQPVLNVMATKLAPQLALDKRDRLSIYLKQFPARGFSWTFEASNCAFEPEGRLKRTTAKRTWVRPYDEVHERCAASNRLKPRRQNLRHDGRSPRTHAETRAQREHIGFVWLE
jgi:hypothetical protein